MNCVISNELHLITDKILTVRSGWRKADASFVSSWLFGHFDIDICIYSTCTFFLLFFFFDCQADFDFDNVQRRELVNL